MKLNPEQEPAPDAEPEQEPAASELDELHVLCQGIHRNVQAVAAKQAQTYDLLLCVSIIALALYLTRGR